MRFPSIFFSTSIKANYTDMELFNVSAMHNKNKFLFMAHLKCSTLDSRIHIKFILLLAAFCSDAEEQNVKMSWLRSWSKHNYSFRDSIYPSYVPHQTQSTDFIKLCLGVHEIMTPGKRKFLLLVSCEVEEIKIFPKVKRVTDLRYEIQSVSFERIRL